MHESYHRVFLSVNRRFFCPLNISQPTIFWHKMISFSWAAAHDICERDAEVGLSQTGGQNQNLVFRQER